MATSNNPRKFSEKIALHNQKQAEETAAFGDNWNDQAMLDMAGRCYLMEQADGALRRTLADSRAAAVREAPRSCRDVCDELEAILSCAQ